MFKKICETVRKFPFISWFILTGLVGAILFLVVYVAVDFESDAITIALSFISTIMAAFLGTIMTHYADAQNYMEEHPGIEFKKAWEWTRPSK